MADQFPADGPFDLGVGRAAEGNAVFGREQGRQCGVGVDGVNAGGRRSRICGQCQMRNGGALPPEQGGAGKAEGR